MFDVKEINIKVANNGWVLTLSDSEGSKEFELFEHDILDNLDMGPNRQAHKLPVMGDMLVSIGRYLLQLDPASAQTIKVGIIEREVCEEEVLNLRPEDEIVSE